MRLRSALDRPALNPTPQPARGARFRAGFLALTLLLGPPMQTGWAQVRLPALGETAAEDFTAGTERRLGEQIMREIVRDPDYLDDPVLQEYLQSLWLPLVAAARQRGDVEADVDTQFAWDAFLVRDRAVNAFALPGGWVGVHLGLIAMTATRDELASVLAHELSHVTQRHIARSQVNSSRQSLVGLAAMILGVLAASRSRNADMAQAAIMTGQGIAVQGQLNFSRDMEREADRMGYGVLASAGFVPAGMSAMFDKLDSANRINDNGAFPYLRSHPLTLDRISEARSRNMLAAAVMPAPPLEHALMQARARVLMDPTAQSLRRLQEPLKGTANAPARDRLPQLYAGALASSMLNEHAQAEAAATEAQQLAASQPADEPAQRELQLLLAQVRLARGNAAGAVAALDSMRSAPNSRAPMLLRAQAALDAKHQALPDANNALRSSTEALQVWLADHKRDVAVWGMLASTTEAIGLRLRSLRANAEARASEGDLGGAIDRLRAAQQAARGTPAGQDFIEASIIDSRLRELQGQRRQLALDARGNSRQPRGDGDAPPQ